MEGMSKLQELLELEMDNVAIKIHVEVSQDLMLLNKRSLRLLITKVHQVEG